MKRITVICKTKWDTGCCVGVPCQLTFIESQKEMARELLKNIIANCKHKPKFEKTGV